MGRREDILNNAYWWSAYGDFKVSKDELRYICDTAIRPDQGRDVGMPTSKNLDESLKQRYGVYFGTQLKHWCGIFACTLLREAGLDVQWTLGNLNKDQRAALAEKDPGMTTAGHMYNVSGTTIKLVFAKTGMKPGDIAIIPAGNHHFLITAMDPVAKQFTTLEGNTAGQVIKVGKRSFKPASADQTITAYYQIQ